MAPLGHTAVTGHTRHSGYEREHRGTDGGLGYGAPWRLYSSRDFSHTQ